MTKIAISAGHNPDGKIACGACGFLNESTENRNIVRGILKRNKQKKAFTMINCTINNATSQEDHLYRCSTNHNLSKADYNVQIHFNSGGGSGSEILYKYTDSKKAKIMNSILKNLEAVGYKNRGVKERKNLYFLNKVQNSFMIEICFVDNIEDAALYNEREKDIVKAIYKGLRGKKM